LPIQPSIRIITKHFRASRRIAANTPTSETPAAGLDGVVDTVVWLDTAAAALLPD
jgi:hypothetical protein